MYRSDSANPDVASPGADIQDEVFVSMQTLMLVQSYQVHNLPKGGFAPILAPIYSLINMYIILLQYNDFEYTTSITI